MMQFWMPLILAGFSGFMFCACVQHGMRSVMSRPFESLHMLFSIWAFFVSLLTLSVTCLYSDIAEKYFSLFAKSQASLAVLSTLMFLVFSARLLKIRIPVLINFLVAIHVFLLVTTLLSPYGGLMESSSGLYRPITGLMAGRLGGKSPVFGWPMSLFALLIFTNFVVTFYGCLRGISNSDRRKQSAFYLVALLFYFVCVLAEGVIQSQTGLITNLSLLGIGSMVFFMSVLLSRSEREKQVIQMNADLEERVKERTRDLEAAMQMLSDGIKEKEALHDHLMQAQRMESVGQLAGGFAHEFNNILTSVRGYAELALDESAADSDLHSYAAQIVDSSDKAAHLTSQLLGFARKQRSNCGMNKLDELVSGYLRRHPVDPAQKLHVVFASSDNLQPVMIDPYHFEQMLSHLLNNARDAMPDGGSISITLDRISAPDGDAVPKTVAPGNYVKLSIVDTGCGMDDVLQARIFEPFFTTRPPEKSGLGLAVCYGLVKQNRGYIFVSSAVGNGSRFDVYFRCESSTK